MRMEWRNLLSVCYSSRHNFWCLPWAKVVYYNCKISNRILNQYFKILETLNGKNVGSKLSLEKCHFLNGRVLDYLFLRMAWNSTSLSPVLWPWKHNTDLRHRCLPCAILSLMLRMLNSSEAMSVWNVDLVTDNLSNTGTWHLL